MLRAPSTSIKLKKLYNKYYSRFSEIKYENQLFSRRARVMALKKFSEPKTFNINFLLNNPNIEVISGMNLQLSNHVNNYSRNEFQIDTMLASGGGELHLLNDCCDEIRIGSSTADQVKYINNYRGLDKCNINLEDYKLDLMKRLFPISQYPMNLKKKIEKKYLTIRDAIINTDASPGETKRYLGFKTKRDAIFSVYNEFSKIYNEMLKPEVTFGNKFQFFFTLASRPKLGKIDKSEAKAINFKPMGRAINMSDAIEQLLSYPIWKPCFQSIMAGNKMIPGDGIGIGIRRNNVSWQTLGKRISEYEYVMTGDYSEYDTRIPGELMEFSLDLIKSNFNLHDINTRSYWINYKKIFKNNIVTKNIIIQDKVFLKVKNGIPSGMLMTSFLTSVANYVMLYIIMKKMGYDDFMIVTYGDDHIIAFNKKKTKNNQDKFSPSRFMRDIEFFCMKYFGMINKKDGMCCVPTKEMRVGYKRPIYSTEHDLTKGTRNLKPEYYTYHETYDEIKSYDHSKGESHRWNYHFANRPSFLSYYWDENFNPIRPTQEVISRIVNPEAQNVDLMTHQSMLLSALFDNIHNHHVVNHLYFYTYDIPYLMENCKVNNKNEMRLKKEKKLIIKENKYTIEYEYKTKNNKINEGERMWLRRINYVVDETKHKEMQVHNTWFNYYKEKALKKYYSSPTEGELEFYELQKNRKKFNRLNTREKNYIKHKYLKERDMIYLTNEMIDEVRNLNEEEVALRFFMTIAEVKLGYEENYLNDYKDIVDYRETKKKRKKKIFDYVNEKMSYFKALPTLYEKESMLTSEHMLYYFDIEYFPEYKLIT